MKYRKINSYPKIGLEYFFPFFLAGIGFNVCEDVIVRNEGYPSYLILYALDGSGEVCVNNEKYILGNNSSFVIRKNVPHQYRPLTDNWNTHWIAFDGFACSQMLDVMHIGDCSVFRDLDLSVIHKLLRKIYLYSAEHNEYGNFDTSVMVYQFLIEYDKLVNHGGKPATFKCNNAVVLSAKRFIDQYYFKQINLNEIAEYAFVSPQHLCRLFKEYLNTTPKHYLFEIRIRSAKFQLVNTDKAIAKIAEDTGFSSAYYFSNMFKRSTGVTPSQFRTSNKVVK